MKTLRAATVLGLLLGLSLMQPGYSEDKPTEKKEAVKTPAKEEVKLRLQNHFGKLGLTTEQREKVLAIQGKYASQIAELQKQLAELRAKQDAEIHTVLNVDQKELLEKLKAEAKQKAETKAAANVKPAAEKKPVSANGSEKKDKKKEEKDK